MIKAEIILDSVAENGKRIVTWVLEYPRYIHSEVLTHRVFSRNSASSRAIPINTMLGLVWNNPADFVHWGKNQSGMQANEELTGWQLFGAKATWWFAGKVSCGLAWVMSKFGAHKQLVNRMTEPWSHMKVVLTSTEWDNFFSLRNHPDAQPEIRELARQMWELFKKSVPKLLKEGEWHLPFIDTMWFPSTVGITGDFRNTQEFFSNGIRITLETAKKLSASLCAQVSYRKADESVEKAIKIYDRLVVSKPVHASPFEHQATPAKSNIVISGNFRGWHQLRQYIPENVCKKYTGPESLAA